MLQEIDLRLRLAARKAASFAIVPSHFPPKTVAQLLAARVLALRYSGTEPQTSIVNSDLATILLL